MRSLSQLHSAVATNDVATEIDTAPNGSDAVTGIGGDFLVRKCRSAARATLLNVVSRKTHAHAGIFTLRLLFCSVLCSVAGLFGVLSFAAAPEHTKSNAQPGGPMAPATGAWSVVTSPNRIGDGRNNFYAVACVSAGQCWAVGSYERTEGTDSLIERWDGASWSIVSSPSVGAELHGVTCVSASDCWAVGSDGGTLVEHWNGTSWVRVYSPNASGEGDDRLNSVTCVSASDCWAVGYSYSSGLVTYSPLIEHWDGNSWSIPLSPPSTSTYTMLTGVSCASASACWAVGEYFNENTLQSLIEQWDGRIWTVVLSPDAPSTGNNYLNGITCTSTTDCWAVGEAIRNDAFRTSGTLVEHWNGSSWAVISSASANADNNQLNGVTCVTPSDCWAVGQSYEHSGFFPDPLLEHWDGESWTVVVSPDTKGALYSVACVSASNCSSVGYFPNPSFPHHTLAERWNGASWNIAASPDTVSLPQSNVVRGVTCASASDCWAVGYYFLENAQTNQTLIERWNGTSWSIIPSPNDGTANFLNGVTCLSPSDCWAVGGAYTSDPNELIEHWDGVSWAIVPSPASRNTLYAVTCVSSSDCWAVGERGIDHWNGTTWTFSFQPPNGGDFFGVTCTSADNCWALGNVVLSSPTRFHGLILHWNGSSWTDTTAPTPSLDDRLYAVTCTSQSDCWAVGEYDIYDPNFERYIYQTLVEHWDGASWTVVPSPSPRSDRDNYLVRVACTAASECWAVGSYDVDLGIGSSPDRTLIERWDGRVWSIVASPSPSDVINSLLDVTCSVSDCWAVGYDYDVATREYQTLIEQYRLPIPPLSGVVSRRSHGFAGDFDVDLPFTGNPGIECRSGGANGNYTFVFKFANSLSNVGGASVTKGTGSVSDKHIDPGNAHNYIVSLSGVANAQTITVTLTNVIDSQNNAGDISVPMRVLIGDVDGTGRVDGNDVSAVSSHTRQSVNNTNLRYDVDASGRIDGNDVSITQGHTRTSLPTLQLGAGYQFPSSGEEKNKSKTPAATVLLP